MPEIAMDVDDVVAKLSEHWIDLYNKDWDDNLKPEDITEWAIDKFVKPECGRRIYAYLDDPHLYDGVKPVEGAKSGITALRNMGYTIVFVTSCPILTAGRKFFWLKENGFSPNEKDYDENRVKSRLNLPYMLDDRYDNVTQYRQEAFLYTRPWNKNYRWGNRVNNWNEVVEKFREEISLW